MILPSALQLHCAAVCSLWVAELPYISNYKNSWPNVIVVHFKANTALSCNASWALLLCNTVSRLVFQGAVAASN